MLVAEAEAEAELKDAEEAGDEAAVEAAKVKLKKQAVAARASVRLKKKAAEGEKGKESTMAIDPEHSGWPADASIAQADQIVKEAKQWAIDTFNPNCGNKAAEYLKWTSADVSLLQEVKKEKEECPEYEDSARCTGWKLAVQPCLLGDKGGRRRERRSVARSTSACRNCTKMRSRRGPNSKGGFLPS